VDVLITLDGSPLAERALSIGAGLAQLLGGELHLLRVAKRLDVAAAGAYLEDVSASLHSEGTLDVHRTVLRGPSAGETIRNFAHQHGVGLIVIASHGRGGLSRALMGSVATEVVTTAGVPVVVVPWRSGAPVARRGTPKAIHDDS
jgi:nucleotide-binding universal stress UspA family protein